MTRVCPVACTCWHTKDARTLCIGDADLTIYRSARCTCITTRACRGMAPQICHGTPDEHGHLYTSHAHLRRCSQATAAQDLPQDVRFDRIHSVFSTVIGIHLLLPCKPVPRVNLTAHLESLVIDIRGLLGRSHVSDGLAWGHHVRCTPKTPQGTFTRKPSAFAWCAAQP